MTFATQSAQTYRSVPRWQSCPESRGQQTSLESLRIRLWWPSLTRLDHSATDPAVLHMEFRCW